MRADQRGCDCLDGGETTDRTARLGVCAQTTQVAPGKAAAPCARRRYEQHLAHGTSRFFTHACVRGRGPPFFIDSRRIVQDTVGATAMERPDAKSHALPVSREAPSASNGRLAVEAVPSECVDVPTRCW